MQGLVGEVAVEEDLMRGRPSRPGIGVPGRETTLGVACDGKTR
jgi:hypothetical protein